MGELQCGGVAEWGSCGVGELRSGGVAEWGSCGVGKLRCGGVASGGLVVCTQRMAMGSFLSKSGNVSDD